MNKRHGKKLGTVLLGLVCLLVSGCDDNSAVAGLRRFFGMGLVEPGVVATVNHTPIYLHQVEALTDMSSPAFDQARSVTVEELWTDFADSLYELVVQELIHQELEKRGIEVSAAQLLEYEGLVSADYGLDPGPEFEEIIRELGISPEYWRAQLKARLERELWERELLKTEAVNPEVVETYLARHPNLVFFPETYDFLVVEGTDKALLEKTRNSGKRDTEELKAEGVTVVRYIRAVTALPEIWARDLAGLKPGQAAPQLRQSGMSWSYVILLENFPRRRLTPPEQFVLAEKGLRMEALPRLYALWLDETLAHSEIRVASQFRRANIPLPPPRSTAVLPWERDLGNDNVDEALGEVEGENEE